MEEITNNNNTLEKQPLVSIIVITYNSSKYVLETLESAKAQTYQNIELIVSDDCSTDNTVEICREWIEKNKERFVRTELITAEKNTGIPANCNRGVKAAQGEWVKLIAGDDTLKKEAIKNYINFISIHPECTLVHSSIEIYENIIKDENKQQMEIHSILTEKLNANTQFELLSLENLIYAPSVIIKKNLLEKLGGFDESIPLCEDWPFWLKATKNGFKFYYLDIPCANYRIHDSSTYSSTMNKNIFNSEFIKIDKIIFDKYISDNCLRLTSMLFKYKHIIQLLFNKLNINKKSTFLNAIYQFTLFPYSKIANERITKLIRDKLIL